MCLMLWVGAQVPLPTVTRNDPQTPDPTYGYGCIEDEALGAPVRGRFSLPFVSFVGAHSGCGCGFNYKNMAWQGFSRVDEVTPLLGALRDDERTSFLEEQGSRERLRRLIELALEGGPVEVFGCWDGDQGADAIAVRDVSVSYFTETIEPIEEQVLYRVMGGPAQGSEVR